MTAQNISLWMIGTNANLTLIILCLPLSSGCLTPNRLQTIDDPIPEHWITTRQPTLVVTTGRETGLLSPITMLGGSNAISVHNHESSIPCILFVSKS